MDYPVSPAVAALMAKAKASPLRKTLANLELQSWDANHESQLKQYYGYTDETLAERKKELIDELK